MSTHLELTLRWMGLGMTVYLAEAYLHGFDPFAIEFPAGWPLGGIRWYGVAYLMGFAAAWVMVRVLAAKHRTAIPIGLVADVMIYILVGVLVGGRLGYCLFYDPKLLVDFTNTFPYWGILAIHKGGMASHGGMVGVIVACWIFAVRSHISKLHLFDVVAFICPPGLFFGRIANFINAELWGRALPESMQGSPPWWSVKYPQEILEWTPAQQQALESLRSVVSGNDTFLPNVVRAAAEGNEQVIATLRPMLTAYYPSQLLQALTDGPLLMGVLVLAWWGPRRPGVVGSWFLISYGIMRILTEFARQPDVGVAGLATPLGELSRGQVLSALMTLIGAVGLLICARREVEPIGGLMQTSGKSSDS
ncbi:MAG: prolipoprotein diacylglyceryl transferase [Planctomycetota bacterium]